MAGFLGRRIEYVNEVTAYDPPRTLDMRSVVASFPMRITYTGRSLKAIIEASDLAV